MAEAMMNERLRQIGVSHICARSAGTWTLEGTNPPLNTVRVMTERGLDVQGHRAHNVTEADVSAASLVLGMTRDHVEALRLDFSAYAEKILLFSEMAGRRFDIPDPYGSALPAYRQVADVIASVLEQGAERIIAHLTVK